MLIELLANNELILDRVLDADRIDESLHEEAANQWYNQVAEHLESNGARVEQVSNFHKWTGGQGRKHSGRGWRTFDALEPSQKQAIDEAVQRTIDGIHEDLDFARRPKPVLIVGPMASGKTTLAREKATGKTVVMQGGPVGTFNGELLHADTLIVEDAREEDTRLRDLILNSPIEIHRKALPPVKIPNNLHLILISNTPWQDTEGLEVIELKGN